MQAQLKSQMEAIIIDSLKIVDKNDFINNYGLRSYILWVLLRHSNELGFKVPDSHLVSSSLSVELSRYFSSLNIQVEKSMNYLTSSESITSCYYNYLKDRYKNLIDLAMSVDKGKLPIIRGTSCAEGYNNLSFAGFCHSYIPKNNLSFEENIFRGFAKVLSSIYSPYSQYYFNSHNIPEIGKNIGIIMMQMISRPLFHVTAYVYPKEIRIKYFFTPMVGTLYKGGGDVIINGNNEDYILNSEFGGYDVIWKHTINVLRKLSLVIYEDSSPIDVEFLINEDKGVLSLNIVQLRKLSDIHIKNYEASRNSLFKTELRSINDIVINKTYLYHSVINCLAEINVSSVYIDNYMKDIIRVFVVNYQYGVGLFSFLNSLPKKMERKIGLIISHPSERSHDHLQYSIYEDSRIKFVIHVNGELTSCFKDGMIIHMISDGNKVIIREENKFVIDNVNISFVDRKTLPDSNTITAVFLVGFVGEKIIAIRNERGWDIPGGHVEQTDLSLEDALKREVDEEANTAFENAKPYAVIQFEGKEKAMLFYVSNNCKLFNFVPKKDSFERELMTIPDFLTNYNWKKSVIELLIKRALLVSK